MSSASTFNPSGGCAKGHYQLIAFCSLELTGRRSSSFSVQAGAFAAAVQVLEYLEGLRGLRTEPRDRDALGRGTGRLCFELPVWQVGSISAPHLCSPLLFPAK